MTRHRLLMRSTLLIALVGLSACSKKPEAPASEAGAGAPTPPGINLAAANTGKVLQTQDAAGYTYAEVEMGDGRKIWVAGGPIQVKVGDVVQWADFAVMNNFFARSLNRSFDQIYFVGSWGPVGAKPSNVAPHGMAPNAAPNQMAMPMPAPMPNPMAAPSAANDVSGEGVVKSAKSTGDYTYLEVTQGGGTVWIAANAMPVKAGDKVRWSSGSVMRNFAAKSLNRTFDEIIFADQVAVVR